VHAAKFTTLRWFQVCQKLVSINPCNSESLYLLGMAQLLIYDSGIGASADEKMLRDAQQSLQASVDLEGKPSSGEAPALLTGGDRFFCIF